MTTATPLLNMDDNIGLGAPDFFSSAWNPEQNEFSFTEAYQSSSGNRTGFTPLLPQAQAENGQLDYFSVRPEGQFSDQSIYQPKHQPGLSQSQDDLDNILETTGPAFLDKNTGARHSGSILNPLSQGIQMHGLTFYDNSIFGSTGLGVPSLNDWDPDVKPTASPARIMTQMANDTGRRTSLRYGQITPIDSPLDDALSPSQKTTRHSSSKKRGDSSTTPNEAPKAKKPRKSKKKPMTMEQEEAKRKKFLERNRVAADKCRQNRKKRIDDLQSKAHYIGADNTAKKAQLEDLEQEIAQLRSLVFIHSRSCNEKDILDWIEQESSKVQSLCQNNFKESADDTFSKFSQDAEDMSSPASRPTSSHGYGSVSEALSHRYSTATAGEDYASAISAQSSRRPSTTN